MKRIIIRALRFVLAASTMAIGLLVSDNASVPPSSWISRAEAIIGRPLTPLSYAGVARRTTRRAVVAGAAVGSAYAQPVYIAPACVQHVNAYGQIYYTCP